MRTSDDTTLGGRRDWFASTRRSAVLAARSDDPVARVRAFETLIRAYWKPAYKYIRIKWRKDNEAAKDLTQAFFARALEKAVLESYDPERARFRTFLRTCLDNFVANEHKAGRRLKRGGDVVILSLDFDEAEGELSRPDGAAPSAPTEADAFFDREWLRSLFAMALDELRENLRGRGKESTLLVFERYDVRGAATDEPTYAQVARELGLSVSEVTNYLAFARREFRRILLERIAELSADDEEFRSEIRAVLGVDLK